MEEVRVLVVGDDPLARSGLAALLAGQPGVVVAGEVAPDEDLAAALQAQAPSAVVWDLGRGPGPALDRLRDAQDAGIPVLALLDAEGEAVEALAAGARGVLSRAADGERLALALQALSRGLMVFEEGLAASLLRSPPPGLPDLVEPLTPRELEVLQLLSQGLSNRMIAQRLGISEHTAKFHVNAILGKLGARSRTEAIVQAARLGLVLL
jgi:two-component system, NarL family, nitrate/nitrite response regulator NarL